MRHVSKQMDKELSVDHLKRMVRLTSDTTSIVDTFTDDELTNMREKWSCCGYAFKADGDDIRAGLCFAVATLLNTAILTRDDWS